MSSNPDDTKGGMKPRGHLKGRLFQKGNPGGPGRKPRKDFTQSFRAKAYDDVGAEAAGKVVAAMYEKACRGDVAAARLFLEYTIGKPEEMLLISQEGRSFEPIHPAILAILNDPIQLAAEIALDKKYLGGNGHDAPPRLPNAG